VPAKRRIHRRSPRQVHSMHRISDTTVRGERHTSRRTCAVRGCQLRTSSSAWSPFALALVAQLVQQGFCLLQVGGVEALGEPVVDIEKHLARLFTTILFGEQSRDAGRRA